MNKKGFLLVDSLVAVFIVGLISELCIYTFKAVSDYKDGYDNYQKEMSDRYSYIYDDLGVCEKCIVEEDLSQQDP